jgi:predicted glycosyltransferase
MNKIRVMVCPLDWGLGHATRCIPIIRELMHLEAEVIIAGDGDAIKLLKIQFPQLTFIYFKGYTIKLYTNLSAGLSVAFQIPGILYRISQENKHLNKLVADHNIDVVISDNRYGLWSRKALSILITHQPNIIPPFLPDLAGPLLRSVTRYIIRKYHECWIPDYAGEPNLSGKLSHGYPLPANVRFIGLLSRFESVTSHLSATQDEIINSNYDLVALVSGPEPQRTAFERLLKTQLVDSDQISLLLRGKLTNNEAVEKLGNLTVINHLSADDLYQVLTKRPVIICRGGYSTLMDIEFTGNKVICIPTPGQTEQEYLAVKGQSEHTLVYAHEDSFDLSSCLSAIKSTKRLNVTNIEKDYRQHIKRILQLFAG